MLPRSTEIQPRVARIRPSPHPTHRLATRFRTHGRGAPVFRTETAKAQRGRRRARPKKSQVPACGKTPKLAKAQRGRRRARPKKSQVPACGKTPKLLRMPWVKGRMATGRHGCSALRLGRKRGVRPWRRGGKPRFGHGPGNKLSPSVWKDTEGNMYVLGEGHGGTEGKRHGGARRRAAWLFGLATGRHGCSALRLGRKRGVRPWRRGGKPRFGHGPGNKLSPSVWKDTEGNMYVLGEGHGGTEGKRHGGARRRAAWLFGLASGLKTRGSPWRAGRKQRFGHGRENELSPSVWKDTEPTTAAKTS